jgi:UDP-N-acetylglucosamine acyltransferase
MIHPTAIISENAQIGKDVHIGPFCFVHDNVTLGDGCYLDSHVTLGSQHGELVVGKNNKFYGFSIIGGPPQDLKYKGEKTRLVIGDNNTFRESVTLNIGTAGGGGQTSIGSGNLVMAYCHVAHDCHIGNNNILANLVQMAGHVTVEDKVNLGALSAVNQFVRIGRNAFVAGASMINKDIIPFCIAQGNYATIRATNKIGLQRSGMTDEVITSINRAVRILTMGSTTVNEALERIKTECIDCPEIQYLIDFARSSERGLALS